MISQNPIAEKLISEGGGTSIRHQRVRDHGFTLKERRSERYPASYKTDADYSDDLALISNTIEGAATLLHSLEKAANCQGEIHTITGHALKSVEKITYLGSDICSTDNDVNIRIGKALNGCLLSGNPS